MTTEEIRALKCNYGRCETDQALVYETRFQGQILREIAVQLAEMNARMAHYGDGLNVGLCSTNDSVRVRKVEP